MKQRLCLLKIHTANLWEIYAKYRSQHCFFYETILPILSPKMGENTNSHIDPKKTGKLEHYT
jgi:hypothetical protein